MSEAYDMIVMGDINLDWHTEGLLPFTFSELLENGRIEWKIISELPGGSGLNFSRFAQEAGYKPLLLGKVGNDPAGNFIYNWLQTRQMELGVTTDRVLGTGKAFIVRDRSNIRFLVNNAPNANQNLSVSDVELYADTIQSCPVLYISGYCLMHPDAPRKEATLSAIQLARQGGQTKIVFDVVPHRFYQIYNFSQFKVLTSEVDVLISEVSTVRRFLNLGSRDEQITLTIAEETAKYLSEFYDSFILRYGPSGCDEQLIKNTNSDFFIHEETGHANAPDKRGYGDRIAIKSLKDHLGILPTR